MNFEEFKEKYQKIPVEHFPNEVTETPMVSVCVQTYQHVEYIEDCLEGILMQETDFSVEILLGEDASTDGTREICIEYVEKYPDKIRLFLHKRENNISVAGHPTGRFNFLYNLYSAKGKYIALCEGDDYWTDPLKLQKQVELLEKLQDVSLCCHFGSELNCSSNKSKIICKHLDRDGYLLSKDVIVNRGGYIPTASIMFRNNSFKELFAFLKCPPIADFFLQSYLALNGRIYFLNMLGCVYRRNANSSWTESQHINKVKADYCYNMICALDLFYLLNQKHQASSYLKKPLMFYLMNYVKLQDSGKAKFLAFIKAVTSLKNMNKSTVYFQMLKKVKEKFLK